MDQLMERISENEFIATIFGDANFFTLFLMTLAIFFVILLIYIFARTRELEKKVQKTTLAREKEMEKNADQDELSTIIEKMQSELVEKKEAPLEEYEDEQEEKAIISYEELKKQSAEGLQEEIIEFEEQEEEEAFPKVEEVIDIEKPKFRNSEIISPVFGRIKIRDEYQNNIDEEEAEDIFSEETPDTENLVKKSEELLQSLKDFRNNLDK